MGFEDEFLGKTKAASTQELAKPSINNFPVQIVIPENVTAPNSFPHSPVVL
jgi:hypothetical protein